jgi:hypothetical protein
MLTVGKHELGQCITDLAVWHVMSGMGETANGRRRDAELLKVRSAVRA